MDDISNPSDVAISINFKVGQRQPSYFIPVLDETTSLKDLNTVKFRIVANVGLLKTVQHEIGGKLKLACRTS